jgi:hypothetical protein
MKILLLCIFTVTFSQVRISPYDPEQYIKGPITPLMNDGKCMVKYSVCDKDGHCDHNNRPEIRCVEESQGIFCHRRWEYRPDKVYKHTCPIPPKDVKFKLPYEGNVAMKDLKRKHHVFIVKSALSYVAATSPSWYDFFYTALKLFKESGFANPEDWFRRTNRQALPLEINEEGRECMHDFLSSLDGEYVSFSVDAYTLYHRHQIAIMLCAPHLDLHPRLVYLEQDSNEQASYAKAGKFLESLCRFFFYYIFTYCNCVISMLLGLIT